jgi:hypothetical protein
VGCDLGERAMEGSAVQNAMGGSIPAESRQAAPADMHLNYRKYIQQALRSIKSSALAENAQADLPLEDCQAAEVMLKDCVQDWAQDKRCEKLVIALQDGKSMVDKKGILHKDFANKCDKAIVGTLLNCKELDVGFAGLCLSL